MMPASKAAEAAVQGGAVSPRDDASNFVASVGQRVRIIRRKQKMSRRILSERSGVSQRHLAQLESGSGNISLALFYRIASALGHKPSRLLEGETGDGKARRICLIGLRGAGKSTLGAMLAQHLSCPFAELNTHIEERVGIPAAEVMAFYGPEGYRRFERQALEDISTSHDRVVLAVGGGLVTQADTYRHLLTHFNTIWLRATPQDHMQRVLDQGDHRPMAGRPAAMDDLKSILSAREPLYERADMVLDTSGRSVEQCLAELTKKMTFVADDQPLV